MSNKAICGDPDCVKEAHSRGLCSRHYLRLHHMGNLQGHLLNCAMCGGYFWSYQSRRQFCSKTCKNGSKYYYNRTNTESDPQKVLDYQRDYREQNREHIRQRAVVYNAKNRPARVEYMKSYNANNPEAKSTWAKKNPLVSSRTSFRTRKRRGKASGVEYGVLPRFATRALNRSRNCCYYCGNKLRPGHHWDHVFPVVLGGDHGESNLVPACRTCNSSKNDATVMQWRIRMIHRQRLQEA